MTGAYPEVGPALGRLAVPGVGPLAAIRLELATSLFEAVGRARQGQGTDGLLPARWRSEWERAVQRATAAVVSEAEAALHEAAAVARLPRRRLAALTLTETERHGVAARLGGEGVPLIRLLSTGGDAPLEGERLAAMARELDAAWVALEGAAGEERARWSAEAALVRAWRPPRCGRSSWRSRCWAGRSSSSR